MTDIKILNQLIEQSNPFSAKVTAQHNVWSHDYSGVAEINQNAFNSVLKLIDDVDTGKSTSEGAALIGERGLGKTQLLARLRHDLNTNNKAFFVYMGEYDNLDLIKVEFLQAIVYSLKREYRPNVTQWQALAAAMYFDARGNTPCSVEHLISQFPKILANKPELVNSWTKGIAAKCPDIKNVFLIRAILWTLLPEAAPFAAMWLAGKKLSEESAKSLGLPVDRETDSFAYTCDLLNLIARYKTIVFCFDELDTPQVSSQMLTIVQVVIDLAKYLRNNIKRIVILLAVFPQTLEEDILSAQSSVSSQIRAAYDRFDHQIRLEFLDEQSSLALIKHRLQQFYKHHDVVSPDSFYPFQEDKLRQIFASERATARQVLRWCEENWAPIGIDPPPPPSIAECFKEQMKEIYDRIDEIVDDSDKISKALRFAFNHLVDKVVEDLRVFEVVEEQDKKFSDLIPFKIKVRKAENQNGPFTSIGVAVIQKTGNALTSALSKLVEFNNLKQTRACMVRSENISGATAQNHALTLLKDGGEWVAMVVEQIAPLLALQALAEKLEQYELTPEQVMEYVDSEKLLTENALIKEILSKPEGKPPKTAKPSDINKLASIPQSLSVQDNSEDIDLQADDSLLTE
ncbi:Metal-dependent hydrolases of the beta-lactamase superfamily I [Tumidithrix helvetica PCC 7403]|uniref:P-loop NTPase fold protein n=1 Tax=Tumidithrix helvetica TaxID=3457545 RepID=UPI003C8DA37B